MLNEDVQIVTVKYTGNDSELKNLDSPMLGCLTIYAFVRHAILSKCSTSTTWWAFPNCLTNNSNTLDNSQVAQQLESEDVDAKNLGQRVSSLMV